MKKQKRIHLNLASHPMKNQRFFFLLLGILVVLFFVVAADGIWTYWKYSSKDKDLRDNNAQIEKKINTAKREEVRLSRQIDEAKQEYQGKVDLLNTLILKKSFSWVDFLSSLEDALPASCYIEAMTPTLKENNQMEVRLTVDAPNLDELLKLNQNLYKKGFTGIRITNEAVNDTGFLKSEITLIYERTF